MSHLAPIYDVWDGNAESMAADIGELGVTVRQWRNRENIPVKYWPRIISAAARRGHELSLSIFVPVDTEQLPVPSPDTNPAGIDLSVGAGRDEPGEPAAQLGPVSGRQASGRAPAAGESPPPAAGASQSVPDAPLGAAGAFIRREAARGH